MYLAKGKAVPLILLPPPSPLLLPDRSDLLLHVLQVPFLSPKHTHNSVNTHTHTGDNNIIVVVKMAAFA